MMNNQDLCYLIDTMEQYFWNRFRAMDCSDVIRSYFPVNGESDHAWEEMIDKEYNEFR